MSQCQAETQQPRREATTQPAVPDGIRMKSVVNLGKLIIVLGAILIAAGLLLLLLARAGLPIGRLPGDFMYRRRNFAFYFPLTTSILLSIVLSLVFYFLSRMRR
jgi:H+/Cl- antiporter ClcA